MSRFIDQEAQCHECNARLVLVGWAQVCPDCDCADTWPNFPEEVRRG